MPTTLVGLMSTAYSRRFKCARRNPSRRCNRCTSAVQCVAPFLLLFLEIAFVLFSRLVCRPSGCPVDSGERRRSGLLLPRRRAMRKMKTKEAKKEKVASRVFPSCPSQRGMRLPRSSLTASWRPSRKMNCWRRLCCLVRCPVSVPRYCDTDMQCWDNSYDVGVPR